MPGQYLVFDQVGTVHVEIIFWGVPSCEIGPNMVCGSLIALVRPISWRYVPLLKELFLI